MRANYDKALAAILHHEGGYVNHPKDPGGATNRGVTQRVYDAWRLRNKLQPQSVKFITSVEIMAIYKKEYWDKVHGDDLPSGVDYCLFDFAINSGHSKAIGFLQRVLGVTRDGKIGPQTLAAVSRTPPMALIDKICDARQAFLEGLTTFATFGKGWTKRVREVRTLAKEMV